MGVEAVKNAIRYEYNNGLAEGSVNKLKLIKRIMMAGAVSECSAAKLFYWKLIVFATNFGKNRLFNRREQNLQFVHI
jgi:hypothetical protein